MKIYRIWYELGATIYYRQEESNFYDAFLSVVPYISSNLKFCKGDEFQKHISPQSFHENVKTHVICSFIVDLWKCQKSYHL